MEMQRHDLAELVAFLGSDDVVALTERQETTAYVISPRLFKVMMESVETLEDIVDMRLALADYEQGEFVEAEEAFARLGL